MADINALMGLGITDEEQLRELADQLRGRQRAADFFSATTVPSIRGAANREQEFVADAAKQAGVLKRALEDRKSREQTASQYQGSGLPKYMESYRNNATGEVHKIGMVPGTGLFNFTTGQPMETLAGYTPDPMSEKGMQGAMSTAMGRAEDYFKLDQSITEIVDMLGNYQRAGVKPEDIPGMTWLQKNRWTGGPARMVNDVVTGKSEASDNYATLRGLMNQMNRALAGLTQTKTELGNIEAEAGLDLWSDPRVFVQYLPKLQRLLQKGKRLEYAAMSKSMQQQLERSYGELGMPNPYLTDTPSVEFDSVDESNPSAIFPSADDVKISLGEMDIPLMPDGTPDISEIDLDSLSEEQLNMLMQKFGLGGEQ